MPQPPVRVEAASQTVGHGAPKAALTVEGPTTGLAIRGPTMDPDQGLPPAPYAASLAAHCQSWQSASQVLLFLDATIESGRPSNAAVMTGALWPLQSSTPSQSATAGDGLALVVRRLLGRPGGLALQKTPEITEKVVSVAILYTCVNV